MTKIVVQSNASGTGTFTIAAPNSSNTPTLTLPDVTGTLLTSTGDGSSLTGVGKVLQVVHETASTEVSSSSTTYVDSGLSASITPSSASSKILVLVNQNGMDKRTGNTYIGLKLQKNGSDVVQFSVVGGATGDTSINNIGTIAGSYLDSPSTTDSVTYKTQFNSNGAVAIVYVQKDNAVSSITLMEIAG